MTRFKAAWMWNRAAFHTTGAFIDSVVRERPVLNVCAGNVFFGDLRVDAEHPWPDVRADARALPFRDDSFASVFMDPPWSETFKAEVAAVLREAVRVAPVAYVLAPWVWGTSIAHVEEAWVRWQLGVHRALLLIRYVRRVRARDIAPGFRATDARRSTVSSVPPRRPQSEGLRPLEAWGRRTAVPGRRRTPR